MVRKFIFVIIFVSMVGCGSVRKTEILNINTKIIGIGNTKEEAFEDLERNYVAMSKGIGFYVSKDNENFDFAKEGTNIIIRHVKYDMFVNGIIIGEYPFVDSVEVGGRNIFSKSIEFEIRRKDFFLSNMIHTVLKETFKDKKNHKGMLYINKMGYTEYTDRRLVINADFIIVEE